MIIGHFDEAMIKREKYELDKSEKDVDNMLRSSYCTETLVWTQRVGEKLYADENAFLKKRCERTTWKIRIL